MKPLPQLLIRQITLCLLTIIATAFICFYFKTTISYRIVAIILLFVVSVLAVTLDIIPVLFASTLAALILNFFFIPPLYTFHISGTDDILLFIIFFIVAVINAVLNYKIRKAQNQARDKKEKENTIKLYNTLFNSLSHELRTPIATIMASTDALQNFGNSLNETNKHTLLEQVSIAANRLNDQVENLLSMSRLETGMLQLKKSWCDINDTITESINKMDNNPTHQIIYNPNEALPIVEIDAGIIQQVLQNILSNAINYTPPKTIITISVVLLAEELLQITIADNGNGVSNEILPFLFDKFYRGLQTKTGGTGLGLSIVKGYIEAHNGTVSAFSNTPSGLIIKISLSVKVSYINKLKNE